MPRQESLRLILPNTKYTLPYRKKQPQIPNTYPQIPNTHPQIPNTHLAKTGEAEVDALAFRERVTFVRTDPSLPMSLADDGGGGGDDDDDGDGDDDYGVDEQEDDYD